MRATCLSATHCPPLPYSRVRLFNKGDSVANEVKRAKLKREYRKMNDLSQLIYWSDVGREGAKHFEQLLEQKKMAQNLNATLAGDISVEKAQKMIAKAIEVQKKADAARAAKAYKVARMLSSLVNSVFTLRPSLQVNVALTLNPAQSTSSSSSGRSRSSGKAPQSRASQSNQRSYRSRQRGGQSSGVRQSQSRLKFSRASSSKSGGPGNRA